MEMNLSRGGVAQALSIRRAVPADVPALLELLDRYARIGLVLPRAETAVYRQSREYVVAIEGGRVVGCAGLRIYHQALAEVVGVAVVEDRQGQGIGRRVVESVIDEARSLSIPRIFALTMQEPFFLQLGFRIAPMAEVPEKIEADRAEGIERALCMKTTMIRDLMPNLLARYQTRSVGSAHHLSAAGLPEFGFEP